MKRKTIPQLNLETAKKSYLSAKQNLAIVRERLKLPLTLTEKILFGHLEKPEGQALVRGQSHLLLKPDRIAMHDVSGQMALLQFMLAGRNKTHVPASVHCDHLIQAFQGGPIDTTAACNLNREIYEFLSTASAHFQLEFWEPGSGIIHQVVLENYAYPGSLLIGTDSHTANAGGLGNLGIGVGGSDASDVMAGIPWEIKYPKIVGIHLQGRLSGWTSAKDVILNLCGRLTTKGCTGKVIEYFGEGAASLSCTSKATIANMGAELGATSSIFPWDESMSAYLRATGRSDFAILAKKNSNLLTADPEVLKLPNKYFDEVYEIDLSTLEPQMAGPHSPDIVRPISSLANQAKQQNWPTQLSAALIGSCTNSSYEDLGRVASIAQQALDMGLKMPQPFYISPGSQRIQKTLERDGQMKILADLGASLLANACGPCIGQWRRKNAQSGAKNTILTSFNRNFRGRNDGNQETLAFVASPEIVLAIALSGRLDFNPMKDSLISPQGEFRLTPPLAPELPANHFIEASIPPVAPSESTLASKAIVIQDGSQRLQQLTPFKAWTGSDFVDQALLIKVKGKCTTDQISPAGAWLRYRGHLENISENLLLGATDFFGGTTENLATKAKKYKSENIGWIIVGDENYGEGSSREHAAMSPRFLGCTAVIAKSFARIHESNLKKQGVLALTFADAKDYDKVKKDDLFSLEGLVNFSPGTSIKLKIRHPDSSIESCSLKHSYTCEQIQWFQAGSALNWIRDTSNRKL